MKKQLTVFYIVDNRVESFEVEKKTRHCYYPDRTDKTHLKHRYRISDTYPNRQLALIALIQYLETEVHKYENIIKCHKERMGNCREEVKTKTSIIKECRFEMKNHNPECELC